MYGIPKHLRYPIYTSMLECMGYRRSWNVWDTEDPRYPTIFGIPLTPACLSVLVCPPAHEHIAHLGHDHRRLWLAELVYERARVALFFVALQDRRALSASDGLPLHQAFGGHQLLHLHLNKLFDLSWCVEASMRAAGLCQQSRVTYITHSCAPTQASYA